MFATFAFASLQSTPLLSSHATLKLSQARSDLGAAAADGAAVFAGGCSAGSTGGGKLGGGCKDPSAVIDIIRPSASNANLWEVAASTASLSAARGWPAVCSFGPAQEWVAVLGGGDPNPNSVLDVISVKVGTVYTNESAVSSGRWGTSCASAQDGSQVIFAGGKHYYVKPQMADEVYVATPPPATTNAATSAFDFVNQEKSTAAGATKLRKYSNDPSTSWLSYAQFTSAAGGKITMMNTTVIVPSAPTKRVGSDPSFWFGLQTGQGDGALIQPILAWDQRDAGFGVFHEVFDWSTGQNHDSPEHFHVPPGDVLTQSVSYRASDNSYDMYLFSHNLSKGISWNYKLSAKQGATPETVAYIVVEHAPMNCAEYPSSGGIDFTQIYIEVDGKQVVDPLWVSKQEKPACGSKAEVVDATTVSLKWNPKAVAVDPTPSIESYSPSLTLAGRLSEPREDCGAVGYGPKSALFAGGWVSNEEPGNPSRAVDAFIFNHAGAAGPRDGHSVWSPGMATPSDEQYWVGAVAWNESTVFLADATTLYEVNSADMFSGAAPALRRPLPAAVAAVAGIPAGRVQQNGVRIPGAVCFYAALPTSALLCWSPGSSAWSTHPCAATHVAGGIAVVDSTVFVGGGFGADQQTVGATVDVFTFN